MIWRRSLPPTAAILVIEIAIAACAKVQPRSADSQRSPAVAIDTIQAVTPDGYGVIRIGASIAQLGAAIGTAVPPSRSADEKSCRYVLLAALPPGMRVMLVGDSVARIDVTAAGPRTAAGAGIGDSEARVVALYSGRAVISPNKYTGPVGHDIVVIAPADSTRRLIFETDGAKILRFRAGRQPAVDLVEGCG